MPVLRSICQYYFRLVLTNGPDELHLTGRVILKETIRQLKVFSDQYTHNKGGGCGFLVTGLYRAPGTQFTFRKINNANFFTVPDLCDDSTGATQLNVIRVCTDGEYI